jgi:hypothetical protein
MSEGKAPPRDEREQRQRQREREPMSSGGLEMRVDAALGDWPTAERAALDWDESADRVMSRIVAGDTGHASRHVSDEDLFAAPLAVTSDEAQNSAAFGKPVEGAKMAVTSERRERRSFQELAEMARSGSLTPPPAASVAPKPEAPAAPAGTTDVAAKGSGVLDLAAMAAADPAGAERAQSTPLAASGLFEEPPSAPSVQQAALAAPAAVVARAVPTQAPEANKKSGAGVYMLFGGVAVIAAAAAGFFFVVKPRMAADANKVALAPPPPAVTQQAPAQPVAQATAPKQDNAIDPTALPTANASGAPATPTGTAPFPVASGALPFAAPKPQDPTPQASAVATAPAATTPDPVASAPAPGPTSSASLEEQMRQAAGPSTSATAAPTVDTPQPQGAVPMKPSQGAVSGAISAVMPAARQCLGPDDPVSHATIIFQSNGSVQSVSITGGAQGKPAETCLRQALMRAKIAPFAQQTFTAYATIRPN